MSVAGTLRSRGLGVEHSTPDLAWRVVTEIWPTHGVVDPRSTCVRCCPSLCLMRKTRTSLRQYSGLLGADSFIKNLLPHPSHHHNYHHRSSSSSLLSSSLLTIQSNTHAVLTSQDSPITPSHPPTRSHAPTAPQWRQAAGDLTRTPAPPQE